MSQPTGEPRLRRALGVAGLVAFGLAYIDPLAMFDTFGVVSQTTHGHVPTAYVVTFVAMLFTAASYAVLVHAYPSAGSAYTFARRSFGGNVGFLTGWALMLDYLLLPLVNYLLIGIYLNAQFPAVPAPVFWLAAIALVTTVNIVGVVIMNRLNFALVGLQLAFVLVFITVSLLYLRDHPDASLLQPLYSAGFRGGDILGGAAVVALSFVGFDAVSTMAEEARNPRRTVPLAIILTVLIGGATFLSVSYCATLVEPDYRAITTPNSAALQIVVSAGGHSLQTFFIIAYMCACSAAALSSQVSVTRILYAMGRDGVLPRAVFGRISRRFRTPIGAALVVSAVSTLALIADLETMASIVSFGALAAFTLVHLAVTKHFLIDQRRRGWRSWALYAAMPAVGVVLTGWLWTSLSVGAFAIGFAWLGIGTTYLAVLTRGFREPAPAVDFDADAAPIQTEIALTKEGTLQ
ncbi:putrescine importer [Mycobacterium marinum]|uniref:APC family permease n=2 Tax=Mycobacterium marinum TaxID=1781 RepID=UPI000EDB8825|nr:APC family permease [Mycobacterium marinum]RFZ36243.1 Putrescine importer PuuP [Mycobacterium marinum]GJN96282.1 putrescine importer [Mycobacterium marinum]GJO50124.1 putrescine importer [Mycobacterium marinum]GJO70623.1 putrescine importer [Mycobacterium marinum]GJO80304.1 putrescine importer [Mycobacterium marinum]